MKFIDLPGMDARIELAKSRVWATIYGEDSEIHSEHMLEIAASAEYLGRNDFHSGNNISGMFAGEPILIKLWLQGGEASALIEEMSHCDYCCDGSGDPCPTHG